MPRSSSVSSNPFVTPAILGAGLKAFQSRGSGDADAFARRFLSGVKNFSEAKNLAMQGQLITDRAAAGGACLFTLIGLGAEQQRDNLRANYVSVFTTVQDRSVVSAFGIRATGHACVLKDRALARAGDLVGKLPEDFFNTERCAHVDVHGSWRASWSTTVDGTQVHFAGRRPAVPSGQIALSPRLRRFLISEQFERPGLLIFVSAPLLYADFLQATFAESKAGRGRAHVLDLRDEPLIVLNARGRDKIRWRHRWQDQPDRFSRRWEEIKAAEDFLSTSVERPIIVLPRIQRAQDYALAQAAAAGDRHVLATLAATSRDVAVSCIETWRKQHPTRHKYVLVLLKACARQHPHYAIDYAFDLADPGGER